MIFQDPLFSWWLHAFSPFMYLAFLGKKAHSFLRCVKRLVTTANKKKADLQVKATSKQVRAEFQQNNLLEKGGLGWAAQ